MTLVVVPHRAYWNNPPDRGLTFILEHSEFSSFTHAEKPGFIWERENLKKSVSRIESIVGRIGLWSLRKERPNQLG